MFNLRPNILSRYIVRKKNKWVFILILLVFFIASTLMAFLYITKDSYNIPILMYHYVTDSDSAQAMHLPKENFRRQIEYLKKNKYKFLTLDDVYQYKSQGRKFPRKSIVITFDDGYENIYDNALPILKEYGAKGSVFVISSKIGVHGYLNKNELQKMAKSGVISVQAHTVNHKHLNKLKYEEQLFELENSKKSIEDIIEQKVDFICYPYGEYNKDTISAAQKANYKLGFTIGPGITNIYSNNYELKRFPALNDLDYIKEVIGVSRRSDFKYFVRRNFGVNIK